MYALLQWFLFFISGKFDSVGIATATLDDSIGKVRALRLHVHSESNNWAILSEVSYHYLCYICCIAKTVLDCLSKTTFSKYVLFRINSINHYNTFLK